MHDSLDDLLLRRWQQFSIEVKSLMQGSSDTLGEATPPEESGVYVLFDEYTTISYVGVAVNLRDRLHKHISGDESHAIQRAYEDRFPDRTERRDFIKCNVRAKWLLVRDRHKAADFERLLIWLFQPLWNRQ